MNEPGGFNFQMIQNVVVLGGGSAGLLAALSLKAREPIPIVLGGEKKFLVRRYRVAALITPMLGELLRVVLVPALWLSLILFYLMQGFLLVHHGVVPPPRVRGPRIGDCADASRIKRCITS